MHETLASAAVESSTVTSPSVIGVRWLASRKIRGPSASLGMTQEEGDTKSVQAGYC
jgi:hypothetical protein